MYRWLTSASLSMVLVGCSDLDCAPGERKIGSTCHELPGLTREGDAQVAVAPAGDDGGALDAGTSSPGLPPDAAIADSGPVMSPLTSGRHIVQLAVGESTTYALWSDGTASQWGQYDVGADLDPKALGLEGPIPFHTRAMPLPGITDAKQILISYWNACALFSSGKVGCWGNHSAIFARGVPSPRPEMISDLSDVTQLSNSVDHACAITSQDEVRCWGDISELNFAFPDPIRTSPRRPSNKQAFLISGAMAADEVTSGGYFSCVRGPLGVHCWGTNDYGQLGDGTNTKRSTPQPASNLVDVVEIASGNAHTCARIGSGEVRCWGANAEGELGVGTNFTTNVPTKVQSVSRVIDLALGAHHSCALHDSGKVSCWGANKTGQLGDGTTTSRNQPVPVTGLTDVVEVSAGVSHTCARLRSGEVHCWGLNDLGQLGDGTTLSRTTPVKVLGFLP